MADILIRGMTLPEDGAYDYHLTIRSDGKVEGRQQVDQRIVRIHSWAVEVKEAEVGDLYKVKRAYVTGKKIWMEVEHGLAD